MPEPSPGRSAIDWQAAYATLERVRHAVETGGQRPASEVTRILRQRAALLARPLEDTAAPADTLHVLVVSLGGEQYGVETTQVEDVVPLPVVTPVPCAPPFIVGVISHHGCIIAVLDFRRLLNLLGHGTTARSRVVVVHAGTTTVGVLVDAVEGIVQVAARDVAPPPPTRRGAHQAFVRGVTPDIVALLDLDAVSQRITGAPSGVPFPQGGQVRE